MGGNSSKGEPVQLKRESETDDNGFEDLGRYQGSKKDGKRHGHGLYFFNNGDIYDGEWRKGRKEGYGTYQFADGKKNIGWFYRDQYVGKEPNEKLKRKMRKKRMSLDAEPLSKPTELPPKTPPLDSDSEEENKNIPKLKDPTTLDLRRADSMRRQQYYRAKYNIPDKQNDTETMTNDARGLRDSIRAKWGIKRSKSCNAAAGKRRKDPRLLTEEEEKLERETSRRQRESIRARYNLQ